MANRPHEPFRTLRSSSRSRLVLTCEHAGATVPGPHRPSGTDRRALRSHWGFDIGARGVTRAWSRALGATAILGRFTRLWVDLNRRADDATLIRTEVEGEQLSFNRGTGPRERARRLAHHHVPYHAEIERQITRRLAHGVAPVLLAVHTYTPVWNGRDRGFDIGVLYDRDRGLARRLATGCRDAGFSVRYNEPYSGRAGMMYSADRHGTHFGIPCLEIEINQRRVATASDARDVAAALASAVDALAPADRTAR